MKLNLILIKNCKKTFKNLKPYNKNVFEILEFKNTPFEPIFTRESSYAIARLSYRNSVRPSVTRVDQAKTVQARISKSSPSAAWKTLVSGTVKLFRKLEGGHPERGR